MYELYKRERSSYWQAKIITSDGEVTRISTKTADENAAKIFAAKKLEELNYRLQFGLSTRSKTVEEVYNDWFNLLDTKRQNLVGAIWRKHLKERFAKRRLENITADDIETVRDNLPYGNCHKQRVNFLFNGVYDLAIKRKIVTQYQKPMLSSMSNSTNIRAGFDSDEISLIRIELKRRIDTGRTWQQRDLAHIMWVYVNALIASGARPGTELLKSRWCDWAYASNTNQRFLQVSIKAENSKVKKARTAVCDTFLNDILMFDHMNWAIAKGCYSDTGYVFVNRKGQLAKTHYAYFERMLGEIGLLYNGNGEKRTLYSLRHYKISDYLQRNVSAHIVAKQCGTSTKMIDVFYSKVVPSDVASLLVS